MGALTLKNFLYEVKLWDSDTYVSVDPTDGFGANTQVYARKNSIVQVEPDSSNSTYTVWLTDKGRQFFSSIFGNWYKKGGNTVLTIRDSLLKVLNKFTQMLYTAKICRKQQNKYKFFNVIFEIVSIEVLSIINIFSQNHSFIKLKRAESYKNDNNLESTFQLNLAVTAIKLNLSTLCLLISNNPRYEGYSLNLNLRQRILRGDFKCLLVGSFVNLTFPLSFIGASINILGTFAGGSNIACKEFKFSKTPVFIFNQELYKRHDGKNTIEMFKVLKHASTLNNIWRGLNTLNSSLHDMGANYLNQFKFFCAKDLNTLNSLYFLNVPTNKIANLKKIVELKLLNHVKTPQQKRSTKQIFLDQNSKLNSNLTYYSALHSAKEKETFKYIPLTSNSYYESDETFINTEGLIKRVTKIIKKKTKNSWQIVRKILKHLDRNFFFFNKKENNLIFFNSKKITNFKNYINCQYQAAQILTNASFYFSIQNNTFIINKINLYFKQKLHKLLNTKLKYWLDDFFSGGKDEYSEHSSILINCSKISRSESTNFF
jgi:NADH dehydrogenase/NADH:ubiquinone oxidoreductase subunit G